MAALTTSAAMSARVFQASPVTAERPSVRSAGPVAMAGFSGNAKVAGSVSISRSAVLSASTRATLSARRQATRVMAAATTEEAEYTATLRNVRMSPYKVRRVLDQIRGRSYEEALMILEFMPYKACEEVLKTVYSAAANAKNNFGVAKKSLVVSNAQCDEGPTLRRFQPRAQGRGYPIRKRTCTIKIAVKSAEASDE